MMSSCRRLLLICLILLVIGRNGYDAVGDPWTSLLREFAYSTKENVQRFLAQLQLPRIVQTNGGIAFQIESADNAIHPNAVSQSIEPIPLAPQPCPMCRSLPPQLLTGQWRISIVSRDFRLNAFSEVDAMIDRLTAGLPISITKTFADLIADPPEPICPVFTLLDAAQEITKCELVYRMPRGPAKSIVGTWERIQFDGTLVWRIGTISIAQFCIAAMSSISVTAFPPNFQSSTVASAVIEGNNSTLSTAPSNDSVQSLLDAPPSPQPVNLLLTQSQPSFVLLNQIDSWPRCDSFVALTRALDSSAVDQLRNWLELQRLESAFNRLEKTQCQEVGFG